MLRVSKGEVEVHGKDVTILADATCTVMAVCEVYAQDKDDKNIAVSCGLSAVVMQVISGLNMHGYDVYRDDIIDLMKAQND